MNGAKSGGGRCAAAAAVVGYDRSAHQIDVERHARDFMEAAKNLRLYLLLLYPTSWMDEGANECLSFGTLAIRRCFVLGHLAAVNDNNCPDALNLLKSHRITNGQVTILGDCFKAHLKLL